MTDQAYLLDQLSPIESLRLIHHLARLPEGPDLCCQLRALIEPSVFGPQITLILPALGPGQTTASKQRLELLNTLLAFYANLKGTEPTRSADPDSGAPLDQSLASLILYSESQPGDRAEPLFPDEFLLIGRNINEQQAAAVFDELRFHATHSRIATASSAGTSFYLYHVLDDHERRSSFQAAHAGGAFAQLTVLLGYAVEQQTFFLPRWAKMAQSALKLAAHILQKVPQLLKATALPTAGPLLAIDKESQDSGSITVLYLGNLTFFGQVTLAPLLPPQTQAEICWLEDSPSQLAQLQATLRAVAPSIGYRLELRPVHFRDTAEIERLRLLERQTEIHYKLAYLDSVSAPKPKLLCFEPHQMPLLAELISHLPLEVLRQGRTLYAFQAATQPTTNSAPHVVGRHYLFVDHQEVSLIDTTLTGMTEVPRCYWLDPFWARYYYQSDESVLVFVPNQTALFPAMHDWSTDSMANYLRDIVGYSTGAQPLPEKPFYLFDHLPGTEGGIRVEIFDRNALQPLHLRLGWLNDHLHFANPIDLERTLNDIVHNIGRTKLAEHAKEKAQTAESELEDLLLEVNRMTARKLSELTEVVNQEISNVLEQTQVAATFLEDAKLYLENLNTLGTTAQKTNNTGFQDLVKTEGKHRDLQRFIERLEHDVDHEIQMADTVRQRMTARVRNSVKELGIAHDQLREKLLEILRLRQ